MSIVDSNLNMYVCDCEAIKYPLNAIAAILQMQLY